MTQDLAADNPSLDLEQTYARLSAASPAERKEIVLQLIELHPDGRLELPARDGRSAVLDGIDLSQPLHDESDGAGVISARKGDPSSRRISLKDADLRGARLVRANLSGADLASANLEGAFLGGADLRGAFLGRAKLANADLAGARLDRATVGEADLRGAMLEEATLQHAVLRFTNLEDAVLEDADLRGADLRGATLRNAVLTNADLRGAVMEEAKCQGVNLSGARLGESVLNHADLRGARLDGADLRGATLISANLNEAVLKDARLQELELSTCLITHVHLCGTRLDGARFQKVQLGDAIGEEKAGKFEEARRGYLVLERVFLDLGDPDAASWAYKRRRRMQKWEHLREARLARAEGRWRDAAGAASRYSADQAVEWLCDYGESIPRVMLSLMALYLAFTILYGISGSVVREHDGPNGLVRVTTRDPVDLTIFSLLAMTTGSIGIHLLPSNDLALALVGLHVFLGIALIGLLGFVVGNRVRR